VVFKWQVHQERTRKGERVMDIVERLRGIYRTPITDGLGSAGGDEPVNPHEFVRKFETPPIQHEAANVIERLQAIAVKHGLWKEAPCCLCGYNGPNYFQPSVHKCAAIEDSE
jgi:hypothetical protein